MKDLLSVLLMLRLILTRLHDLVLRLDDARQSQVVFHAHGRIVTGAVLGNDGVRRRYRRLLPDGKVEVAQSGHRQGASLSKTSTSLHVVNPHRRWFAAVDAW